MKKVIIMVLLLAVAGHLSIKSFQMGNCEPKEFKCENEANNDVREAHASALQKEIDIVQASEDDIQEEQYCDSLEMMAACVEAEAGNQGLYGKRLVADVILNRVDSDRFPNDIVSVISQRNQFSTYFDGAMDRVTEPSEETIKAVQMELEHRIDTKILFFTAGGFNPYCKPAYKYKDHYFGY